MPDDPRENHEPRTRLAPSPTGALHLGNARTFLVNWALARRHGWRIVLRIEDTDTPRVKPGAEAETIDVLAWLGIDWDEGPYRQTDDLAPYREAMRTLAGAAMAYPCALTRSEIAAAASAPQEGTGETPFPGALRPALAARAFDDERTNWRFVVEPGQIVIEDAFAGRSPLDPASSVGDFVVWTRRAQPAYQLAVVVDDHAQRITHVVRGDDLLDSAARQTLLYRALGLGPGPAWCHLPLVRGEDGRRLAKRHGDTRLSAYRARGVPPEAIVGLLAHWCGITTGPGLMDASEFRERCTLGTIPPRPVMFRQEEDRWLRSQAR